MTARSVETNALLITRFSFLEAARGARVGSGSAPMNGFRRGVIGAVLSL
jgi:hypothetical protein